MKNSFTAIILPPFDAKTHVVASAVQRERVGRANPF